MLFQMIFSRTSVATNIAIELGTYFFHERMQHFGACRFLENMHIAQSYEIHSFDIA